MLISDRASYLTRRDEELFADLYLTRYLTTEQIARMHFLVGDHKGFSIEKPKPSNGAADRRLYRLSRLGWVDNHSGLRSSLGNTYKLWVLSQQAFERERDDFGDGPERRMPHEPKVGRLDHLVHINDLYVACAQNLRFLIGDPDADGSETWTWRYEGKEPREISLRSATQKLRPDAEIQIGSDLFFVEYQTRESRVTVERMQEKATSYANYVSKVLDVQPQKAQLLLVTDEQRVADATLARAEREGLYAVAGDAEQISEHLISHIQGFTK